MKRNAMPLLVLGAALLAAGVRANDEHPGRSQRGKGPCRADIQTLCKDAGKEKAWGCLTEHAEQIQNADCKAMVQKAKEKQEAVRRACQPDIDKNCQGKDFGSGLLLCLRENRKELSDGCKAALKEGRKNWKRRRMGDRHPKGEEGKDSGSDKDPEKQD